MSVRRATPVIWTGDLATCLTSADGLITSPSSTADPSVHPSSSVFTAWLCTMLVLSNGSSRQSFWALPACLSTAGTHAMIGFPGQGTRGQCSQSEWANWWSVQCCAQCTYWWYYACVSTAHTILLFDLLSCPVFIYQAGLLEIIITWPWQSSEAVTLFYLDLPCARLLVKIIQHRKQ